MQDRKQNEMLSAVIAGLQRQLENEQSRRRVAEAIAADAEERYGELRRERDELLREVEFGMNYPKIEAKNAKDDCYYWARGSHELRGWHTVRAYNYEGQLFFFMTGSECELYPDDISDLRGPIPEPEDE